jgi:hypothetical protein
MICAFIYHKFTSNANQLFTVLRLILNSTIRIDDVCTRYAEVLDRDLIEAQEGQTVITHFKIKFNED